MSLKTAPEIAKVLGVNPKTIYDWAEQRLVPHYKILGCLRFDEVEIQEWLKKWKREPLPLYNSNIGRGPRKGEW